VALVALLGAASADEVILANGGSITGRVDEAGDEVVIHVEGGLLRFRRREVVRIERAPLPADLYAERAAATDPNDPEALRKLAAYATELGLGAIARSLHSTADGVELERRVAAIPPADAVGFRELARWARARGLGREVERFLYERATAADLSDGESQAALFRLAEEERRERQAADLVAIDRAAREAEAVRYEAEAARYEAERARAEAEAARRRMDEEHGRRLELEREIVRLRNERTDGGVHVRGNGYVYPGRVVILYPPRKPDRTGDGKSKPPRQDLPPHRDRSRPPLPGARRGR
jgi:hypothetical protein